MAYFTPLNVEIFPSYGANDDLALSGKGMVFLGIASELDGERTEIHYFAPIEEYAGDRNCALFSEPLLATTCTDQFSDWMTEPDYDFVGLTEHKDRLVYLFSQEPSQERKVLRRLAKELTYIKGWIEQGDYQDDFMAPINEALDQAKPYLSESVTRG